MTCRELIDFIADYLDGKLPDDQRTEFAHHLELCPDCVNYLASYRQTVQMEQALCRHPDDPVPEETPEDLVEAILAARKKTSK